VVSVVGAEHIHQALTAAPSFIPVYWHQHQLFCVKHLLAQRRAGLKLGFLISPSVDGELGAMLVSRLGGVVIRGSSSHTGARALRDYYQALSKDDVSPAITPDGPRGPPWKFKPGAVLLAQLSQRPIIPLAYAASRAWQIQLGPIPDPETIRPHLHRRRRAGLHSKRPGRGRSGAPSDCHGVAATVSGRTSKTGAGMTRQVYA